MDEKMGEKFRTKKWTKNRIIFLKAILNRLKATKKD